MAKAVKRIFKELVEFAKGFHQAIIEESVEAIEAEYLELENAFLTMIFGSLIGVKTMPTLLALELLNSVCDEIKILLSRGVKGEDVIADLMSSLGGEW